MNLKLNIMEELIIKGENRKTLILAELEQVPFCMFYMEDVPFKVCNN